MNEEIRLALNKFGDALARLREGASGAKDDLDRDGVIQRFEFTFELMWKASKIFLESEGVECKTPKDCLRKAFRTRLLDNEEVFLNMLEDRNKTSRIYSKAESERILRNITGNYIPNLAKLTQRLEEAARGPEN